MHSFTDWLMKWLPVWILAFIGGVLLWPDVNQRTTSEVVGAILVYAAGILAGYYFPHKSGSRA